MKVEVYTQDGTKKSNKIDLDDNIFAIQPNDHAIYLDVKHGHLVLYQKQNLLILFSYLYPFLKYLKQLVSFSIILYSIGTLNHYI